ncbi:MAG: 2-C-methyl-D-erythritol 2,4-cyclodiphosphate synthase [Buchnera aphidicola (Schlechtendalia peitan)]
MRIGQGFDVHAFGGVKPLIIGGVTIPYICGLIAYSDGDVVIHAVIDSLMGAIAMGDIGSIFPNTDKKYENINSRILLKKVWKIISQKGYILSNIDIIVIAELPKMTIYRNEMRRNIAMDLVCSINNVSVKFTTTERLGFIGRQEGIACKSIVMLDLNVDK